MEKRSNDKIVENTILINESLDSDDSVELVDLCATTDNNESDQSFIPLKVSEGSLQHCNISGIETKKGANQSSIRQNSLPCLFGSTPLKTLNTIIDSPIVIEDSIDSSEVIKTATSKKRKRLPVLVDLCDDSDKELNIPSTKRPKCGNNASAEVIVIDDTPKKITRKRRSKNRTRKSSLETNLRKSSLTSKTRTNRNKLDFHNNNLHSVSKAICSTNTNVKSLTNIRAMTQITTTPVPSQVTTLTTVPTQLASLPTQITTTASSLSVTRATNTSNVGYNIYNPNVGIVKAGLRPIAIDGSNVAVQHGIAIGTKEFSVAGIEMCIDYFEKRGHSVKAFVPHFRLQISSSTNPKKLQALEEKGKVICTPSRRIRGRTIASYDDRYIVQYAAEFGGVIVSNDNYRDLLLENPAWAETIEKRLLMFTWVNNCLMFPLDPLGRSGPSLEAFLRF